MTFDCSNIGTNTSPASVPATDVNGNSAASHSEVITVIDANAATDLAPH
jgi:hypothetical protein